MSFFRRAGALVARILSSPADPGPEAGKAMLYAKDVDGTTQVFAQDSDGAVNQITPSGVAIVAGDSGALTITQPEGLVVTLDNAFLYVVNQDANSVSKIDLATNTLLSTIPVGSSPYSLGMTPDGQFIYVANQFDATVSVIDTTTDTVPATIPCTDPFAFAFRPDSAFVYVLNIGGDVNVIQVSSQTVIATPNANAGVQQIFARPNGQHVYVSNFSTGSVYRINTTTQAIDATIPSLGTLWAISNPTPDSAKLYAFDSYQYRVIDLTTNVASAPIVFPFMSSVFDARVSLDGGHVFVVGTNANGRTGVIETAGDTVVTTFFASGSINGGTLALAPDGSHYYFTGGSNCLAIETAGFTLEATIPLNGTSPDYTAMRPDGTMLFISERNENFVDVVTLPANVAVPLGPLPSTLGPFKALTFPGATVSDLGGGVGEIVTLIGPGEGDGSAVLNNDTGNDATGANAVAIGDGVEASGDDSFATGTGTSAQGIASSASGNNTIAKFDFSHAEGDSTQANGVASHAEGSGSIAEFDADGGHAEGVGTYATNGNGPHAEGYNTQASGDGAHAEGVSTQADGDGSHAEGVNTSAVGAAHSEGFDTHCYEPYAHAEGETTVAGSQASHAEGLNSYAVGEGVHAHASGPGTSAVSLSGVAGSTQNKLIQVTGETPGLAPGESVELDYGHITFSNKIYLGIPFDNMGYTFVVTAIARGKIAGVYKSQSFRQMFSVLYDGGVATVEAVGTQEAIGSAAASSWTLTGSVATGPDRFLLTFTTGTTTSLARISAKVESIEIWNDQ